MSRSFFDWQRSARAQTRMLYVGFCVVIVATSALMALCVHWAWQFEPDAPAPPPYIDLFLIALALMTPFILGGMYYRVLSLSKGGAYKVAQLIGADELVDPQTNLEKRYLNVVEEISIAAGIPVPQIYILETPTVNAFAAGYSTKDALVCVTRGCLQCMPRAELEAIIGHELGHIVHGDTRINLRAMGVIFGISLLTQLGELMVHGSRGGHSSRSSDSRDGRIAIAGIALMIIGYVGAFAAQIIQSLLSRTREYHADAAAVQFTRNPQSLADALKRIGGSSGTQVSGAAAIEMRHMFFCEAAVQSFNRVFSTHPPIEKRILKLEPGWDYEFIPREVQEEVPLAHVREAQERPVGPDGALSESATMAVGAAAFSMLQFSAMDIERAFKATGNPGDDHLNYARELMFGLPFAISTMVHEKDNAPAVLFALLLSDDPDEQLQQLGIIKQYDHRLSAKAMQAKEALKEAKMQDVLSIFDLLVPALRRLNETEFKTLLKQMLELIKADKKVTLFEWCLFSLSKSLFRVLFVPKAKQGLDLNFTIKRSKEEVELVMQTLCIATKMSSDKCKIALGNASKLLGVECRLPEKMLPFAAVDKALSRCSQLIDFDRELILKACVEMVEFDQQVTVEESQILRAIATLLGCPIPPIIRQSAV